MSIDVLGSSELNLYPGSPASTTAPSSSSPSSSPAPASTIPSTPPTTPSSTEYQSNPLPPSPSVRSVVHSDAEDVASSIDAASASEAEKTDSEDAGDERLPHSLTASSPKQSQQNQQNQKHQRLKSQVATLSNALAAITSEKNKMESSFQADKRRAMEEKEEMASALVVEKNAKESEVAAMKTQVNELKAKLRSESVSNCLSCSHGPQVRVVLRFRICCQRGVYACMTIVSVYGNRQPLALSLPFPSLNSYDRRAIRA